MLLMLTVRFGLGSGLGLDKPSHGPRGAALPAEPPGGAVEAAELFISPPHHRWSSNPLWLLLLRSSVFCGGGTSVSSAAAAAAVSRGPPTALLFINAPSDERQAGAGSPSWLATCRLTTF